MGFLDLLVRIKVKDIENNPKFLDLKKDSEKTRDSNKLNKDENSYNFTSDLNYIDSFQNYEKKIKPLITFYNLTGLIYFILFFGSFLFYCSNIEEAFLITLGSFIISMGFIVSPLWKISGIFMLDEDYTDTLSIFRFSISMFFFCLGIYFFMHSWLIVVPIFSLLSLIIIFILNRTYI